MEEQSMYKTGSASSGMSRRGFLRVMLVGTGAGLVAACAPRTLTPSTAPTTSAVPLSVSGTLTVWGWEGSFEGIQNQVGVFNQRYPNVEVDIKEFGYDDVHTNLLNAIVAGSGAPDLCAIDAVFLRQYVDGLTDLSQQAQQHFEEFVSPTIALASDKGEFYGLATDSEPMGVFYRKDIWDQYGIKEEDINTWADLSAAGDEVYKASQGEVYLYSQVANRPILLEVLAVSQGFPGYYFNEDDTKVVVDDPRFVEAVTVLKRLWDGQGSLHNPDQLPALLKSGKVASQIIGPAWYPSTLTTQMPELAGKWRVMRVPAVKEGGARVGYQYPTLFVVPQQSRLSEAAWELARIGLTGDGARFFFDKWHTLPAYRPLLDELKGTPDEYFGGQKVFDLWDSIARDVPKVFFGTSFKEAQQIMGNYLTAILNGQKTIEDGLREAAAEMRAKLKKG